MSSDVIIFFFLRKSNIMLSLNYIVTADYCIYIGDKVVLASTDYKFDQSEVLELDACDETECAENQIKIKCK